MQRRLCNTLTPLLQGRAALQELLQTAGSQAGFSGRTDDASVPWIGLSPRVQHHQQHPQHAKAAALLSQQAASTAASLAAHGSLLPATGAAAWRAYSARRKEYPLPAKYAEIVDAAKLLAERPEVPPLDAPRPLQFESRRAGVIAVKAGMTQEWDEWGARVPLTVLWVDDCQVVRVKHEQRDGVTALVLGAGSKKAKSLNAREAGEFHAAGVPLKSKLWECRVSEDALLPVGTPLGARHFVAGQFVDVCGRTKDKGFQGVMKRHGFKGQNASHGNTKSHRRPGAIGGRTDPGKVWKGKKMPGHMGDEQRTVKNCCLYKVDPARNLLYVRGQVPGPVGACLTVRDAFRWRWDKRQEMNLPFPTALPGQQSEQVTVAKTALDPYRVYRDDAASFFEAKFD